MHSLIPCNSYLIAVTYKDQRKQSLRSSQSFWIVSISLFLSSSTWPNWLVFSCPVGIFFYLHFNSNTLLNSSILSVFHGQTIIIIYLQVLLIYNFSKNFIRSSIPAYFSAGSSQKCCIHCLSFAVVYTKFCSCFSLLGSMFWL